MTKHFRRQGWDLPKDFVSLEEESFLFPIIKVVGRMRALKPPSGMDGLRPMSIREVFEFLDLFYPNMASFDRRKTAAFLIDCDLKLVSALNAHNAERHGIKHKGGGK